MDPRTLKEDIAVWGFLWEKFVTFLGFGKKEKEHLHAIQSKK